MIKFVIFDMGGVLIEFRDEYVLDYFAKISGVRKERVYSAAATPLTKFATGRINEKEFWRTLTKKTHAKTRLKQVDGTWGKIYRDRIGVRENMLNLVRKLGRSYKVYLLSNTYKPFARYNRARGLYRPFRRAFLSCYMGKIKPERSAYVHVLKSIGAKPAECLFIDDRQSNVAGARRTGMRAIRFTSAAKLKRDLKRLGVKI